MTKSANNTDFTATIIFYLMILQLLNNNNDASNSPITLFELIEYFKRNKKIAIDLSINKKLLALFNKHKELLSSIQIKNKSQIMSDISKLVKTYNQTEINKNFTISFYKKLKKIISKIVLTRLNGNDKHFNVKNIHQIITALLIVNMIELKKIGKNTVNFITKFLKFKMEFFKKFSKENKNYIDKHEYLLNTQYVLNRYIINNNMNKYTYDINVEDNLMKHIDTTVENHDNFIYTIAQDESIDKIIIEADNIEKIENANNDERNIVKVIKIHKRKNTKYDGKRRDNINELKTNNLTAKNFENNAILNENIGNSIDALEEEMRNRRKRKYYNALNTRLNIRNSEKCQQIDFLH